METIERKTCRLCNSSKLKSIIDFGDIYISTFVFNEGDNIGEAPLHLVLCEDCELLQLKHTAPQELLYSGKYWYRSAINPVIVNDLKEIADIALKEMKSGDTIIDVGANDGTLLSFIPNDYRKIGIEPATNLQEELKKHCIPAPMFWEKYKSDYKAKVITAIGMFYDSEDPNKFISNVTNHLTEDGIFISQLMTLKPMLKTNDLGNIVHEHLEYYSYKTLRYLFETNGLEIFKVEENGINGGSYRIFARHYKVGSISYPEGEFDYEQFVKNIEQNKIYVVGYIKKCKSYGEKVYGYGASTKGNTILQYYGLSKKLIDGIADPNPEKIGKMTVATHIPIVSEEEARNKADYFLILPWGFRDSFIEREKDWIEKGGKIITHTPEFNLL